MSVEPFLFSADARLLAGAADMRRAHDECVGAVVVDWEQHGKATRQAGAEHRIGTDTQTIPDSADDLARARASVRVPIICRVNAPWPGTAREVDLAIRLGAGEILVPMVRDPAEVETVLRAVGDRAGVGVMVETSDAVERAAQLAHLPISRAYVGLMDLALDRGDAHIFVAVTDGTLECVRERMPGPFGFGGLTLPGAGTPIPTRLLLAEMTRLECSFTFLRRSFIADVAGSDPGAAVSRIRAAAYAAAARSAPDIARDHDELVCAIARLDAPTGARSR